MEHAATVLAPNVVLPPSPKSAIASQSSAFSWSVKEPMPDDQQDEDAAEGVEGEAGEGD
jgi:hypothetical protein